MWLGCCVRPAGKSAQGLANFLALVPHSATRDTLKVAFMNGRGLGIAAEALMLDSKVTLAVRGHPLRRGRFAVFV